MEVSHKESLVQFKATIVIKCVEVDVVLYINIILNILVWKPFLG